VRGRSVLNLWWRLCKSICAYRTGTVSEYNRDEQSARLQSEDFVGAKAMIEDIISGGK
jgi:hypothetical protein